MQPSPLYAGGARRSAAPLVQRITPATQSAQVSDEVLNALVASMQSAAPAPSTSTSHASGSDSSTPSAPTAQAAGNLAGGIGMLGTLGNMAAALGQLTRDAEIGKAGGQIGQAASVANAIANPSLTSLAPIGLQALGASAPLGSAVMGGIRGGATGTMSGALTGALTASNPALAALSALSGMFGGPTTSQAVSALVGDMPGMSPMGVPNTGSGLLGALASAFGIGQLGQEVYSGIDTGGVYDDGLGFGLTDSRNLDSMGGGQGLTAGGGGMGLSYSGGSGSFGYGLTDSSDPGFGGFSW